jgi:hypothetical protein
MDIFEHKQRYGQVDSIGLRCTRMLKGLLQLARSANGVEIYHKGMQCRRIIICKLIYLMFGASTLWDHS